ncbi:MAG: hypothetical protein U0228_29385 [Myxococcaceae bacterium]
MRVALALSVVLVLGCGRTPLDLEPDDGGSRDAGVIDAGPGLDRCLPSYTDPAHQLSCAVGTQLCAYSWGSGPDTLDCQRLVTGCDAGSDCACALAQAHFSHFCGGLFCSVRSSGLVVVTCAPD